MESGQVRISDFRAPTVTVVTVAITAHPALCSQRHDARLPAMSTRQGGPATQATALFHRDATPWLPMQQADRT